MKALFKVGAVATVLAVVLVAWIWWGPGPLATPATVIIREGSTQSIAARALTEAGAVRGRNFYYLGRVLGSGDPVQAGEFEIPARASGAAILDMLQHGRPVQRLVTVTEGMPAILVAEKLASNRFLTGPVPEIAEGSLLPDSYGYERSESRSRLVSRMQSAMADTLAALWAKRSAACPVATPRDAITLASIVEKETGKASERPMIAAVYCNRLRIGMKLDADTTVIYPVTKGKPLGRRILKSELAADNGYNTYRRPGLPDGPIANPGKDSIAAVFHPAATKALYFVADGSGGHVFAQTLSQHRENVDKWFRLRRAKGEM